MQAEQMAVVGPADAIVPADGEPGLKKWCLACHTRKAISLFSARSVDCKVCKNLLDKLRTSEGLCYPSHLPPTAFVAILF